MMLAMVFISVTALVVLSCCATDLIMATAVAYSFVGELEGKSRALGLYYCHEGRFAPFSIYSFGTTLDSFGGCVCRLRLSSRFN
jgi:hypothetical protein